ncbi:hypothetical protein HK405_001486, partial [Cladochytrium tenue]
MDSDSTSGLGLRRRLLALLLEASDVREPAASAAAAILAVAAMVAAGAIAVRLAARPK